MALVLWLNNDLVEGVTADNLGWTDDKGTLGLAAPLAVPSTTSC